MVMNHQWRWGDAVDADVDADGGSQEFVVILSGGRDRAGLEEQAEPRGDVPRHVELANQEPPGLLGQTMTSSQWMNSAKKLKKDIWKHRKI